MRLFSLLSYNIGISLDCWAAAFKEKKRCCFMSTCLTKVWISLFSVCFVVKRTDAKECI